MKKNHRLMAFMVMVLFIGCVNSHGAAPREITIDSLKYVIEDTVAKVSVADRSLRIINIRERVEVSGKDYPVRTVGNCAGCSLLIKVVFPPTITRIQPLSFADCPQLEAIEFPNNLQFLGERIFENCSGLKSIVIPDSIKSLASAMFRNCTRLQSVTLPTAMTKFRQSVFMGCTSLKELHIPESVKEIGTSCFLDAGVEVITIPNGMEVLEYMLFKGCYNLREVHLPDSLTTIGESAFSQTGLSSIDIPARVSSIGIQAFAMCSNLDVINSYNITPPIMGVDVFAGSYPEFITLHVPYGCKEDYANAPGWKDIRNIIDDLPRPTTGIDEFISEEGNELTEVFTLTGIKLSTDVDHLPSGVYIVRRGASCAKISVR